MADHLEAVYENYVKPLSAADRSRLLEMIARDLARPAPRDAEKRSILDARLGQRNLARRRCTTVCRWPSQRMGALNAIARNDALANVGLSPTQSAFACSPGPL